MQKAVFLVIKIVELEEDTIGITYDSVDNAVGREEPHFVSPFLGVPSSVFGIVII